MKAMLLSNLVNVMLGMLSPELLKKFVDLLLDFIEDTVQKSENKIDDAMVLPLCKLIRTTFGVPDND